MKSLISKENVQYIAHLSRIRLNNDEVTALSKDLEHILEYMEKLKELEVKNVQPTSHVLPLKNVYRDDQLRPSLNHEEVMNIAHSHQDGSFSVPQVI